jgi:hypothetical protein
MVSLTIGLLVLCACGSFLKPIRAVQEEGMCTLKLTYVTFVVTSAWLCLYVYTGSLN